MKNYIFYLVIAAVPVALDDAGKSIQECLWKMPADALQAEWRAGNCWKSAEKASKMLFCWRLSTVLRICPALCVDNFQKNPSVRITFRVSFQFNAVPRHPDRNSGTGGWNPYRVIGRMLRAGGRAAGKFQWDYLMFLSGCGCLCFWYFTGFYWYRYPLQAATIIGQNRQLVERYVIHRLQ